jgi:hypothetical protein
LIESEALVGDGFAIEEISFDMFREFCRANNSKAYTEQQYRPFLEKFYNDNYPVSIAIYNCYKSQKPEDKQSIGTLLSKGHAHRFASMNELFIIATDFKDQKFIADLIQAEVLVNNGRAWEKITFASFHDFCRANHYTDYADQAYVPFCKDFHRSKLLERVFKEKEASGNRGSYVASSRVPKEAANGNFVDRLNANRSNSINQLLVQI